MKKSIYIKLFLTTLLLAGIYSCTNLDEEVYSDIPMNEFFQSEKEVLQNAGRAYTKLQKFPEEFSIWTLMEMASDEMVAPGRDDGFVWDNGRWTRSTSTMSARPIRLTAWPGKMCLKELAPATKSSMKPNPPISLS